MEINKIEQIKQKVQNMYSHLLEWERWADTYGEDSRVYRDLRLQVESVLNVLDRTNASALDLSTVKESSNIYHQQRLVWGIIDKFISAQENYVYAMESVEKGICSQKDVLDFIAEQEDVIIEGSKEYVQLEEITPIKQQERAQFISAMGYSITGEFGRIRLDSSQTEPRNPLTPIENSKKATELKQEVDEKRKHEWSTVSENVQVSTELSDEYDDSIVSIEQCLSKIEEELSHNRHDAEVLQKYKLQLSDIEIELNGINSKTAINIDNGVQTINALNQINKRAEEEIYRIGIQDSMARLAALAERAAAVKSIDKENFANFCNNGVALCSHLFQQHSYDTELNKQMNDYFYAINDALSYQNQTTTEGEGEGEG